MGNNSFRLFFPGAGLLKTDAHAILSPYAVYVHLYMYVQVWVHTPGDPPPPQCSTEERYNNNICFLER